MQSLYGNDPEPFWYALLLYSSAPIVLNVTLQYTDPPTALGFWIALEKCTPENGALSFLPGSHLTTSITKRFVRLPGGGTGFEPLVPQDLQEKMLPPTGKYVLEACEPGMRCPVSDPFGVT
jgi:hypothetical protein